MSVSPYNPNWENLSEEERMKYWSNLFGVDEESGNINWPSIIGLGEEMYTDPGSFCRNPKCINLVANDRYCTKCGKRNEHYQRRSSSITK